MLPKPVLCPLNPLNPKAVPPKFRAGEAVSRSAGIRGHNASFGWLGKLSFPKHLNTRRHLSHVAETSIVSPEYAWNMLEYAEYLNTRTLSQQGGLVTGDEALLLEVVKP